MGQAARRSVRQFSPEVVVERMLRFYDRVRA
jgi:hypothetical protein